jgi:hypothetical protein
MYNRNNVYNTGHRFLGWLTVGQLLQHHQKKSPKYLPNKSFQISRSFVPILFSEREREKNPAFKSELVTAKIFSDFIKNLGRKKRVRMIVA